MNLVYVLCFALVFSVLLIAAIKPITILLLKIVIKPMKDNELDKEDIETLSEIRWYCYAGGIDFDDIVGTIEGVNAFHCASQKETNEGGSPFEL